MRISDWSSDVCSSDLLMIAWLRRLPETLEPQDVRRLDWRTMIAGWLTVTRHRRAAGYMIASGLMQGALFGYLNSSEQIIAEVFDARALFPLIFACVAIGIAIANFSNARIVERFGARRVSRSAEHPSEIQALLSNSYAVV